MAVLSTVTENKSGRIIIAAVCGAILGSLISFTVNCTLVEISINSFFAVYFGVLFILIGALILWRVWSGDHPKPCLLLSFSTLVMLSGFICFVLEKNWFVGMDRHVKVPLYAILGISVTFALLFSIIDLINYCCAQCQNENSKPLVETETQVYLVVACACVMGFTFGFVFGLLDVEDEKLSHLRIALLREESICYPIGALLGGIASAVNQWLREQEDHYRFDRLNLHDDDDLDEYI